MAFDKKTKIHNPQIVTEVPPQTVSDSDIGRIWLNPNNKTISIALWNKQSGLPELRELLDSADIPDLNSTFINAIIDENVTIIPQTIGDLHFDNGYDFFSDSIFLENASQPEIYFYSFFYKLVDSPESDGYVRSISTSDGVKHVRNIYGTERYVYNSNEYNITNYSKINLSQPVKGVLDIIFDNNDVLQSGYVLSNDKKTIYIFCDPSGTFINKEVKIRYMV